MQRWAYEIVRLDTHNDDDNRIILLNKGNLGWELVSVVPEIPGEGEYVAFFKRPVE